MSTISKIFLDSSVLIEALKGTETEFYKTLVQDKSLICCTNEIVFSEYVYHAMALYGGSSPLTLKNKKAINGIISSQPGYFSVLQDFEFLSSSVEMLKIALTFMQQYDMLPNDALILAACKVHNVFKLASHDKDFILPCEKENLQLVSPDNYLAYTV